MAEYSGGNTMPIGGRCAQCDSPISIRADRKKLHNFCSRGCGTRYSGAHPTDAMRHRSDKRRTGKMLPCEKCGDLTYFAAARLRRLEAGGTKSPFCSQSCQASYYSSRRTGAQGSNWKGGVSIYPRAFREARLVALERDGNTCQMEGPHSGRLEVHHVDGDKHNTGLSNLTMLCAKCHKRTHRWCRV